MKPLETFESRKGNKLIFRQNTSDIPSLGSIVSIEQEKRDSQKKKGNRDGRGKLYSDIGKIIDVFGPVKTPWVVVNLKKMDESDFSKTKFYWSKEEGFKKKNFKDRKERNYSGKKEDYSNRQNKFRRREED